MQISSKSFPIVYSTLPSRAMFLQRTKGLACAHQEGSHLCLHGLLWEACLCVCCVRLQSCQHLHAGKASLTYIASRAYADSGPLDIDCCMHEKSIALLSNIISDCCTSFCCDNNCTSKTQRCRMPTFEQSLFQCTQLKDHCASWSKASNCIPIEKL